MRGCPALTPKQLKRALANLKGKYALRNQAMVILGVRSGLRISELLSLKVSQLWDGDRSFLDSICTVVRPRGNVRAL